MIRRRIGNDCAQVELLNNLEELAVTYSLQQGEQEIIGDLVKIIQIDP